jgi:hypothetical protein
VDQGAIEQTIEVLPPQDAPEEHGFLAGSETIKEYNSQYVRPPYISSLSDIGNEVLIHTSILGFFVVFCFVFCVLFFVFLFLCVLFLFCCCFVCNVIYFVIFLL